MGWAYLGGFISFGNLGSYPQPIYQPPFPTCLYHPHNSGIFSFVVWLTVCVWVVECMGSGQVI